MTRGDRTCQFHWVWISETGVLGGAICAVGKHISWLDWRLCSSMTTNHLNVIIDVAARVFNACHSTHPALPCLEGETRRGVNVDVDVDGQSGSWITGGQASMEVGVSYALR
jgi:hypothetical protein